MKFSTGYKAGNRDQPAPLTLDGFTESICPLTSVRIHKSSQWTDIPLTDEYWVTFELINNNILSAYPKGHISQEGTIALFKNYDRFLDAVNLGDMPYIEISDYSRINNIPSKQARLEVSNCLLKKIRQQRLIGHFVYNVPKYIRWMYNIGAKVKQPGIPMVAYTSYAEAIQASLALLTPVPKKSGNHWLLHKLLIRLRQRYDIERYADEIVDYIGTINWDEAGLKQKKIPNSHPFKSVYDALAIVKLDVEQSFAKLRKMQSSLMEASRTAGMAEVANGVIHNVGNVLNSVNVSSTMIRTQLHHSRINKVAKVAQMVSESQGDLEHFFSKDTRGQQLPRYLTSLAAALEEEHALLLRESIALHDKIEHIKEIVSMQQSYGRVSNVSEIITPEQLIEDALMLHAEAITRHGITIHREYDAIPAIAVDKHAVLQILANLILNAKTACTEDDEEGKTITLRLIDIGNQAIRIQVEDNGIGIPPDNMEKIFHHGFTTRKSGHGFGLHSSAITAIELGGSLNAHSEGRGKGAAFTLDLPVNRKVSDNS